MTVLRIRHPIGPAALIRMAVVVGAWGIVALGAACGPGSGGAGGPYSPAFPPTIDRMMKAYPDLASRKFQILADFEDPAQASLFRREMDGQSEAMTVSTERAQQSTGVGSLKMPLLGSTQRVCAADLPDRQWSLYRDWSKYHLLLFSVFSPRDLGGFTFGVTSGTDKRLTYRHPRIFLHPGWNLIRIDMADLGDHINLADVREMQFWCDPLDTPTDLYLDDLLLVDNRRQIFGPTDPGPGDLYVGTKGRRLVVGAGERFELVLSRGRVVQWFDLGRDPTRLHNLIGPGALGPTPVVVFGDADASVRIDDPGQWSALGPAIDSHQTLVEVCPLRAVLQGEWRFGQPDAPATENGPVHRWTYSVYRDGRVYMACSGTARTPGFQPAGLGIVFGCDREQGFTRRVIEGWSGEESPPIGRETYALFSRAERGQADLLVVPARPLVVRAPQAPRDPRLSVLWRLPSNGDQFTFSCLMRVWPPDLDSPEQAGPVASDYCHPLPITLDAGQLVRTDEGDDNKDGFSEGHGYYVVQLDGNVAKVRLKGKEHLRFSPLFKLADTSSRDVWVYIDGRELKELHRDQSGDVLFAIPGVVSDEVLVEVTSTLREATRTKS